jgi:hypothetical protein
MVVLSIALLGISVLLLVQIQLQDSFSYGHSLGEIYGRLMYFCQVLAVNTAGICVCDSVDSDLPYN